MDARCSLLPLLRLAANFHGLPNFHLPLQVPVRGFYAFAVLSMWPCSPARSDFASTIWWREAQRQFGLVARGSRLIINHGWRTYTSVLHPLAEGIIMVPWCRGSNGTYSVRNVPVRLRLIWGVYLGVLVSPNPPGKWKLESSRDLSFSGGHASKSSTFWYKGFFLCFHVE
jgi:hypothetical protein